MVLDGAGSRSSGTGGDPDGLGDGNGHNDLLNLGDPEIVALVVLVLLHGHGGRQGEECAGHGDDAVGMHDRRRVDLSKEEARV
jgi:hypothetical protein